MNRRNFIKGVAAVTVAAPLIAKAAPVEHNWSIHIDACMCCGASAEAVVDHGVTACGDVGRTQWKQWERKQAMRFKDPASWYLPDYPGEKPAMFRRAKIEPFNVIYGSSS